MSTTSWLMPMAIASSVECAGEELIDSLGYLGGGMGLYISHLMKPLESIQPPTIHIIVDREFLPLLHDFRQDDPHSAPPGR
ncbi:uncharacterized protein K489DRAFT_45174 [Dissoconium aciculare CBS 342.82]|uniref:Uncharacterized protein n=1 Tax=Dissoconium aciculare CBS 342.82 TaxID=1314786 RepID=A0A6J3LZI0_9PEZI|nr:uncharacterized protein K489DRAFT_45174 [Dissoconium aciculare CBS 342.82]KAF1820042.1 hypothetical protein K489DRAFT_45174 [Dissoconium aciculare CBS 342.82]